LNGAARMNDFTDGFAKFIAGPSTGVMVNGNPIAVSPLDVECHQHGNQTICSQIVIGSPSVFAGGKPVVRLNDQALCGHKVISASPNVLVP